MTKPKTKPRRKRTAAERWMELTRKDRRDATDGLLHDLEYVTATYPNTKENRRWARNIRIAIAVLQEAAR